MSKTPAMRKGAIGIVQKFFPKVKKVTDSTEKAVIEVTARDAQSKAVRDHGACVMAVACKRKLHVDGVIISRSVAYLIKGDEAVRYQIPSSVAREIVSFDRGAGFETGTYELSKIDKSRKLGGREKRELDPNREHLTKDVRTHHVTTNIRSVLGGKRPEGE